MTTISNNALTNFFMNTEHSVSISIDNAVELGFKESDLLKLDADGDGRLTADELEVDNDLYADFASIVLAETNKSDSDIDEEKEKEEQTKVKDKNNAGV